MSKAFAQETIMKKKKKVEEREKSCTEKTV